MSTAGIDPLARIAFAVASADEELLRTAIRGALDLGVEAAVLEEAILQGIPYSGFPGAIEALGHLRDLRVPLAVNVPRTGDVAELASSDGAAGFERVYGAQSASVLAELRRRHPLVEQWILSFAYGTVMARDSLSWQDKEMLGVASLMGQGRQRPLFSHLRGAIRCGCDRSDLESLFAGLEVIAPEPILRFCQDSLDRLLPDSENKPGD